MKNKKENEDLLAAIQELMDALDLPDWLQKKTVTVLEAQKQKMTDQALYRYLEQLSQSKSPVLPDELMNESWLQSVYASHPNWVEAEVAFLEETSYDSFNTHLEKVPQSVKNMDEEAQRSYIAVSSRLLGTFAQIDEVFHQEKMVKSQHREKNAEQKHGFLHYIKMTFGYLLIIISYLFAVAFFVILDEGSLAVSLITLIITGMIPFTIGLFLLKPVTVQNFYSHTMFRVYCYVALVVPLGFHFFINLMEWKKGLLADPDFIFLRLVSTQWVGILQTILLLLIILLAAPLIIWKKNRKKFLLSTSILVVIFAVLQYATIQDYQAIGQNGVVQSGFGSKETYDWNKVESVTLSGETDFPAASGVRNSKTFKWSFEFNMENGETVPFKMFGYKEGPIQDSLQIKHKIEAESIPLKIDPLTEEDRSFIKIDMDDHQPDLKNDFYDLFETDRF